MPLCLVKSSLIICTEQAAAHQDLCRLGSQAGQLSQSRLSAA